MPTPIVVLFYVWLLVSLGILVYRVVTKKSRQAGVTRATEADRALRTDWAPPPAPSSSPGSPGAVPSSPPAATGPQVTADPVGTPPPGDRPAPNARPTTPPVPQARRDDLPPATTLIEALAGIAIPCDLLPLTSAEGRVLGERDLLLVTSGHPADDVGEAFAAALEALGYEITPMGPVTIMATRGPDRITVVLHERPYDELSGKRSAFPTTKPGDVVLELRL